jgi:transglutaminase-like putative cysteine protease
MAVNPSYSNKQGIANGPIYGSLLVVFCMVLATLYQPLMGWVWVLSACAIAIAYVRIKRNLPSVKNITLNLLAIFCMMLLIYLSSDFGLMATMVNLLVVAACLKLINLHNRADYHLVLIVLFFLIACGFIYHQSIYLVAYYFSCLVVLFVTAFLLNRGSLSLGGSVKQSTKMMLQALPITLILFVVVPRLPPFWQTNVQSNTQTGLSEQITPGDIADLAQSDQLVFRAEFDNILPLPQERYWRSIVLDQFDGKTWKITRNQNKITQNSSLDKDYATENGDTLFRYLVIAQPNTTRWLYSLDLPTIEENMGSIPIYLNEQYQLFQAEENSASSLYILRSYPQAPLKNFVPETDFARYLQVPIDSNQRTQAWIEENIDPQMSFNEKLHVLNGYFLNNSFSYTLKPPLMLSSPIDSFLFDNQKGFCSHYASALTYMLRLSDIPARMVAGYQGGEEQSNNIITVRQYDAHAWVEAYDQEKGWIRFDPTALVAPNRTMAGLLAALNAQESAIFNEEISSLFDASLFDGIRDTLTFIDHNWNQFVLEFNNDAQGSLIENIFGELSKKNLTTFLLVSIAVIGLFVAILFLPYKKWLRIERKTALQKLLKFLAKNGFNRKKHEPLRQFYQRIHPQLSIEVANKLSEFINLYYEYRYQSDARVNEGDLMALYLEVASQKLVVTD